MGQVQLRVYRGTLVHSRVLEQIEVLQDHLLGFDENNLGEVSAAACCSVFIHAAPLSAVCFFLVCLYFFFFSVCDLSG